MPAFSATKNSAANSGTGVENVEVFAATFTAFETARADVLKVR